MTSLLLYAIVTVAKVAAQCSNCTIVSQALGACSVPALTTNSIPNWGNLNLSQNAGITFIGPQTYLIADYATAKCVCTQATNYLRPCSACLSDQGTAFKNQSNVAYDYSEDCIRFGYFPGNSIGFPTTTRTETPTKTQAAFRCNDCATIEEQIDQCSLTPLMASSPLQPTIYPDHNDRYVFIVPHYLFNRTAAECFCSLPVLRSWDICNRQLSTKFGQNLYNYGFDCALWGYWSDAQAATPSSTLPECASSSVSSTTSSGTTTASAMPSSQRNAASARHSPSSGVLYNSWMALVAGSLTLAMFFHCYL